MEDYPWMCDLCYPEGVDLGDIAPGYSLIRLNDKYHILGGQGHSGDIIYTFDVDPFYLSDEDDEEDKYQSQWGEQQEWDCWFAYIYEPLEMHKMHIIEAYRFIDKCKEAGWDNTEYSWVEWVIKKCDDLIHGNKAQPEVQG